MIAANRFFDVLESRTLMSGTTEPTNPLSTAVIADRQQINVDLTKFRNDGAACETTLKADIAAIRFDGIPRELELALYTEVTKLRADMATMRTNLQNDRLAEATNVLADENTIVNDRKKGQADRGNETATHADRAKLIADRIKLQTDMVAGLNTRLNDRQAAYATIFNDCQAIVNTVHGATNVPAIVTTAIEKWFNDKTTCLNTMTADLQKLIADRNQLVTDLTAMQTAA